MNVNIRKFEKTDIPNKVNWINDPGNNMFLHYDLPLNIEATEVWFDNNKDRTDRYDAVIEVDNNPIGLIGLLSIDRKNKKAEFYIALGDRSYRGKGVAYTASKLMLLYAFSELSLNKVYFYTETDNASVIKLYERLGFKREGVLSNDLFSKGRFVDRYVYGITKRDFYGLTDTPIQRVDYISSNRLYIKRDDLVPFSFGGNKARKAKLFFDDIDNGGYDCVVTYGSSSSNHSRVVANMAASRNIPCYIVSPEESYHETYNSLMVKSFGAEFIVCSLENVHSTIEKKLDDLRRENRKPYFIYGGGHGNIGTQAYVDCYEEIKRFEKETKVHFDYIFLASGTGTTQAGLVCGQIINRDDRKIVGISIARTALKGRAVVIESINDYLQQQKICTYENAVDALTEFTDDYIEGGYGKHSSKVDETIKNVMTCCGIPLDSTYTGKAFTGMLDYIEKNEIIDKNILFIHTGGTPIHFDDLKGLVN